MKRRTFTLFNVFGWYLGDDYDSGRAPNCSVQLLAVDEAEADERGDRKLTKLFGRCEVVISTPAKR